MIYHLSWWQKTSKTLCGYYAEVMRDWACSGFQQIVPGLETLNNFMSLWPRTQALNLDFMRHRLSQLVSLWLETLNHLMSFMASSPEARFYDTASVNSWV
jgi:hypothetical protein